MTILSALAELYERLEQTGKAPPLGYSMENIGGEVVLDRAGRVLAIRDIRVPNDKGKRQPKRMAVPVAVKRSVNITPNILWDKTAYILGLTALKDEKGKPLLDENGKSQPGEERRTAPEHEAFVKTHEQLLNGTNDTGLNALLSFVRSWRPIMFVENGFSPEVLDENLVFRLDGDFGEDSQPRYIHERAAARKLLAGADEAVDLGLCLVSGKHGAVARLHPSIKGVQGAQSSGASLVSFNADAYTSFGKAQGDNAPVSATAAFAYGTALNTLLAKGSGRNLRIGDTTVVFWAKTPDPQMTRSIEEMLFGALNPPDEDAETGKLRQSLENIAAGRGTDSPVFTADTRVFILGLAPNAARLSVRFWRPGTLGDFAQHITQFWADLALNPPAWKGPPAAWSLLYEVAAQRDAQNIPPRLAGDLMQAVLSSAPYPRTLLAGVIRRIRADHDINARRVAIITAHIRRNLDEKEFPMSLDRDNPNPAYRLGRLFGVLESIQKAALPGLNATIRDRYFAAASATPARVFPLLVKTATHHLSKLRKGDGGGLAHWFDAEMGQIWAGLAADLPRSLNLEDQGRFIAGYYHQRRAKKDTTNDIIDNGSIEE